MDVFDAADQIIDRYRAIVGKRHPAEQSAWPLMNGFDVQVGSQGDCAVFIYKHTGAARGTINYQGIGKLQPAQIGAPSIRSDNVDAVRTRIEKIFDLRPCDGIVISQKDAVPESELEKLLARHEQHMGLSPMKIFLSHKGIDKPRVREFKKVLELLGFDPWLDEDAMAAGAELQRAILSGLEASCAAVFFVTKDFRDDSFLRLEVNYAAEEKRKKEEKFSIIVLKFPGGVVPSLFSGVYIYKEPQTGLDGLYEIIRALPVRVGQISWR